MCVDGTTEGRGDAGKWSLLCADPISTTASLSAYLLTQRAQYLRGPRPLPAAASKLLRLLRRCHRHRSYRARHLVEQDPGRERSQLCGAAHTARP